MDAKTLGTRITEARKRLSFSQTQLGQQLFISAQAVGKWERGESVPDSITLVRLSEVLNVDLNYFSGYSSLETPALAPEYTPEPDVLPTTDSLTKPKLLWDMSKTSWADADFSGLTNLKDQFSSSNLKNCKFIGSDMQGLLLKSNNVDTCDFSNSELRNCTFQSSFIRKSHFSHSDLSDSQLKSNNIDSCDFSHSNLADNQIQGTHLNNTSFADSSLEDAYFVKSSILACNFNGADFTGVVLESSAFQKCMVSGAVWKNTSFKSTYITDIVFSGLVDNCSFENCDVARVTFKDATITNTFFKGNSLKKISFENCIVDRITYEFLKGAKAKLEGVGILTSD